MIISTVAIIFVLFVTMLLFMKWDDIHEYHENKKRNDEELLLDSEPVIEEIKEEVSIMENKVVEEFKPLEIENKVEPEIEYAVDDYSIIDQSLFYRISQNSYSDTMTHTVRGVFSTGDRAGKDYNKMLVHLIIRNKNTDEVVIESIQEYHSVTSPNSDYYFGFTEITDYSKDEFVISCSITAY